MKKRKKKCKLCDVALVVAVLVLIFAIAMSSNEIDKNSLSERDKYALFRADMTCRFAEYGTANLWQAMDEMEVLVAEYDYEPEDIQYFEDTYGEDNDFWKVLMDYTKELCPETYEKIMPN